ncbi:hypothetical protein, partial [Saccharopolyspora sp. NPDC002578]
VFSLRDLFPKWLRHEGKSCPREKTTENPPVVGLLWWSLLSGFAADKTVVGRACRADAFAGSLRPPVVGWGHSDFPSSPFSFGGTNCV